MSRSRCDRCAAPLTGDVATLLVGGVAPSDVRAIFLCMPCWRVFEQGLEHYHATWAPAEPAKALSR